MTADMIRSSKTQDQMSSHRLCSQSAAKVSRSWAQGRPTGCNRHRHRTLRQSVPSSSTSHEFDLDRVQRRPRRLCRPGIHRGASPDRSYGLVFRVRGGTTKPLESANFAKASFNFLNRELLSITGLHSICECARLSASAESFSIGRCIASTANSPTAVPFFMIGTLQEFRTSLVRSFVTPSVAFLRASGGLVLIADLSTEGFIQRSSNARDEK